MLFEVFSLEKGLLKGWETHVPSLARQPARLLLTAAEVPGEGAESFEKSFETRNALWRGA